MVPPPGHIVGISPYFFSVGQSFGPIRSMPYPPIRATFRHFSSSGMVRPSAPGQIACLIFPRRYVGFSCALASANALAPAKAGTNDRRVMDICYQRRGDPSESFGGVRTLSVRMRSFLLAFFLFATL